MDASQGSKEVEFNYGMASVSPAALFARNYLTSTGLTWGYFGGQFNGVAVANGTVALTASSTNYVVAHRTTGAVTAATNTTNWLNTATYLALYSVVTSASAATNWTDYRQSLGAAGGGGGTPGGSDATVQYNSSGAFAGNSGFAYNATTNTLTIGRVGTSASNTTQAGFSVPHGTAPAVPSNGDIWTTTAGIFARINGATISLGGGLSNPMTTSGDIIYGAASGVPTRIGIGATGNVLTVVGGIPAWTAPSVGSGDLLSTLINAETSVAGATTLTSSAFGVMHICSGTTSDYTVALPAASGNAGKIIGIRMSSALTKVVTIDANASELIDGALVRPMWTNEVAILKCDGTGWAKIGGKSLPMACELTRTATQSFSANTVTNVDMTAITYDNGGLGDLSTERITIKRSGTYLVRTKTVFTSTALGQKQVRLDLNGSNADSAGTDGAGRVADKAVPMAFSSGNYITVSVYNQSVGDDVQGTIMSVSEIVQW